MTDENKNKSTDAAGKILEVCPYGYPADTWMQACAYCKSDGKFNNCLCKRGEEIEEGEMSHLTVLTYGHHIEMPRWLNIWSKMPYWYADPKTGEKKVTFVHPRKIEVYDFLFKREIEDQVKIDVGSFTFSKPKHSAYHHKAKPRILTGLMSAGLRLFGFEPTNVPDTYCTTVKDARGVERPDLQWLWQQKGIISHWLWMFPLVRWTRLRRIWYLKLLRSGMRVFGFKAVKIKPGAVSKNVEHLKEISGAPQIFLLAGQDDYTNPAGEEET